MSKVSIIMNCHNGEKYMREAIDSIYNQSYSDWDIIFWDNCSTDETGRIAKSYDKKLKYFRSDSKTTLGKARRLALEKNTSDFVCFLDYDDLYLPYKIEKQLNLMENTNFALCCGRDMLINDEGKEIRSHKLNIKSGYIFKKLLLRYQICFQSAMIRSSILKKENISFLCDFEYAPDYDLFMKIASKYQIGVDNNILVKHRIHKGSLSSEKLDRVYIENKKTLDSILNKNLILQDNYKREIDYAYKRILFYKSIYKISIENYIEARKILNQIKFVDIRFFIIYILVYIQIPKNILLKILKR